MSQVILIEDYNAWRKAVKALDKNLDKEVKVGLKKIGTKVATKAQKEAEARGFSPSGDLVKKLKPSVKMKSLDVIEKAKRPPAQQPGLRGGKTTRADYPYPYVYEYGGRTAGGSRVQRAFLAPAVEASTTIILDGLSDVMTETARKAGFIQ